MSPEEKKEIALALEALGVDSIEAGFPASSAQDFKAVSEIAQSAQSDDGPVICALARARNGEIDAVYQAIKAAKKHRTHTFISTSDLHIKEKLGKDRDWVLAEIEESVIYAGLQTPDVQWSAEDATRTDIDFLCKCIRVAIRAGALIINLPDTVGIATPWSYGKLFADVRREVPEIAEKNIILSAHCHNDLGLAVANSLAAIMAGARQVECTINGIGERAGNAALEEIVMALKVRSDEFNYSTGIITERLKGVSRLVENATFPVQYNKAIVGRNAFAHAAGIHQHGMGKNRRTYEIMTPESVGVKKPSLDLDRHTGRAGFATRLKELGYTLGTDELIVALDRFMKIANEKKSVPDEDIIALVEDETTRAKDAIKFLGLWVTTNSMRGKTHAKVALGVNGKYRAEEVDSNGTIEAIAKAIKKMVPHEADIDLYEVHGVTEGTNAQAKVTIRLKNASRMVTGQGAHEDTLEASVHAYLHALNKLLALSESSIHSTDP